MRAGIGDDLWMERMSRGSWRQLAAIAAAFLLAIALGSLLAWVTGPKSELYIGASCFLFLLVFMGGYSLWVASATALLSGHLLRGMWVTILNLLWRRQRGGAMSAEWFQRKLLDRDRLAQVMRSIRRRTFLFPALGTVLGLLAGLVAGIFSTSSIGWIGTWLLYTFTAAAYGWVLGKLAHAGHLPLPAES